jgi:hypothetical protein
VCEAICLAHILVPRIGLLTEDEHYLAVDEQITLDRVLFAFRKYLGRDPSWRTDFRWEKLDL